MVAIAEATRAGRLPVRIAAVLSDQPGAAGLERARELGLPHEVVAPRQRPVTHASTTPNWLWCCAAIGPALVVLAGFMRILGHEFVSEFAGRLLNIHPSLLPSYRGLHTHRRVLADGGHEHGCSVHFVTDELDGGPVILQARVTVQPERYRGNPFSTRSGAGTQDLPDGH